LSFVSRRGCHVSGGEVACGSRYALSRVGCENATMIVKRGASYGVSVYDPVLKRKRWMGTFPTLRDAREAERDACRRRLSLQRVTCGEFTERWLVEYARAAPATRRTHKYAVRRFADDFGSARLAEVDKPTARTWALAQPQSNVRVVRALFSDAINDGLHPGPNPFANLRLEQSRGRKDLVALTEDELQRLGEVALAVHEDYGATFRAMILFAAYVGLRPGELFALERADIDRDEVAIRRTVDGIGGVKAPKNGRTRTVTLPPPARDALLSVVPRVDVPLLFLTRRGRQFKKSSLLYYWNPVRAAFGRPGMDFYELRHFCATHLLELGVAHADVAVQLGHTDGGALVMSTYGHPSEDAARERLKRAYEPSVSRLPLREVRSQLGSSGS
jgi:integrase